MPPANAASTIRPGVKPNRGIAHRSPATTACVGAVAALLSLLLAAPQAAFAHGLVGRVDLPIPTWLVSWAAAAVLVVSFGALAVLWRKPKLEDAGERRLGRIPRWGDPLAGAAGVALLAGTVYAGLAGNQIPTRNVAPTIVYVVFWIGLVPICLLFGNVFRALSPWRAIGRLTGALAQRLGMKAQPLPYPERLGHWPAALGILAFVAVELALSDGSVPRTLAFLVLAYTAVTLVAQALYGVEAWTTRGEAFAVYFGLYARLAPLAAHDGHLFLRRPLAGVTSLRPVAGTVALLCAMIGTTSFDGFSSSRVWNDALVTPVQDAFEVLGFSQSTSIELTFLLGILGMIAVVAVLYRAGVSGAPPPGPPAAKSSLVRGFAHTLVPIAAGYVLAHCFSLLVYQGQALVPLASDPLGTGADLLGTAGMQIDYSIVGATQIWYVQVGVLLAGHVAGLILAHERALVLYADPRDAVRSQYWLLGVMVAFTCLGLFLLSALDGA